MANHRFLLLLLLGFIPALSMLGQPSQADSYRSAANGMRSAANQTQCPQRKQWLLQKAAWCDCMVSRLGGNGANACAEPAGDMPRCEADENGANTTAGGNSNITAKDQFNTRQAKYQQELQNADNASQSAIQQALANGRTASGAMLDATLAGAAQFSNWGDQKTYLLAGGAVTLLTHLFGGGSKQKEREQQKKLEQQRLEEEEQQAAAERKQLAEIAQAQAAYYEKITRGQSLGEASLKGYDSVWCYFIAYPKTFSPGKRFTILMSGPVRITKYSDDTWPLLPDLISKFESAVQHQQQEANWFYKVRSFFKNEEDAYEDMLTIQADTYRINGNLKAIDFDLKQVQTNTTNKKSFWDEN